ncbi:MAG: hypothetical protein ACK5N8_07830 [Alphaproteobacteria bacterium]
MEYLIVLISVLGLVLFFRLLRNFHYLRFWLKYDLWIKDKIIILPFIIKNGKLSLLDKSLAQYLEFPEDYYFLSDRFRIHEDESVFLPCVVYSSSFMNKIHLGFSDFAMKMISIDPSENGTIKCEVPKTYNVDYDSVAVLSLLFDAVLSYPVTKAFADKITSDLPDDEDWAHFRSNDLSFCEENGEVFIVVRVVKIKLYKREDIISLNRED